MRAGGVGVAPTVVSFSSAMSACGRDGRWESALSLLGEMRTAGIAPDAISYNAAISACATASNTSGRDATSLLDEMRDAGLKPTVVSFGAAIGACERGLRWERALSLLDEMRREGVPPDMSCFREAMQVLVAAPGKLNAAFVLLRRVQDDTSFSLESRYVIHHTLLSACRRTGDERAAGLQAAMRALGLSAPSAAVVARFSIDGDERQLSNGTEAAGSAVGEALNVAVAALYDKVRSQTAYVPRLEALPLDFVQRASEAEQVRSLKLHAEKKALACLLLHGTGATTTTPLRMRIDCRVCADCHAFLSHAATLLGRPIHVSEPTRQHRFDGDPTGVCSPCGGSEEVTAMAGAFSEAAAAVDEVEAAEPEAEAVTGSIGIMTDIADDASTAGGAGDAEPISPVSSPEVWTEARAKSARQSQARAASDAARRSAKPRDPSRTQPPALAIAALAIEEPNFSSESRSTHRVVSASDSVPSAHLRQDQRAQRRLAREKDEAELLRACLGGDAAARNKELRNLRKLRNKELRVQLGLGAASVLVAVVLGWCCDLPIARVVE